MTIRIVSPSEARQGDYVDSFRGSAEYNQMVSVENRLAKILKRNGVKRELVKTYVTKTHTWQLFLMP